jgi:hypothetical protein
MRMQEFEHGILLWRRGMPEAIQVKPATDSTGQYPAGFDPADFASYLQTYFGPTLLAIDVFQMRSATSLKQ